MNTIEYQKFCEDFFKQGSFQSVETLEKEIGSLTAPAFQEWLSAMMKKYDMKYAVISEIIKNIRIKENFNFRSIDVDWEKDPIHKEEHKIIVKSYQAIYNNVYQEEIEQFSIVNQKNSELQQYLNQKEYAESLKVSVKGKNFVAEKVISVLWSGWECDDKAWLVNDNGQKKIVMTNHGSAYFAEKDALIEKIKEYEDTIKATQDMLNAL